MHMHAHEHTGGSRPGGTLLSRGWRGARLRALAAAVGLTIVTASTVAPVEAQSARSREALVAKLTGKRVRMDAATRKPRAITADEARELLDQIAAVTEGTGAAPQPVSRPDGSLAMSLDGQTGHVLVGRPNEDGTMAVRCVTSVEEAVAFLSEEAWPES
jgi:hypothetical protein